MNRLLAGAFAALLIGIGLVWTQPPAGAWLVQKPAAGNPFALVAHVSAACNAGSNVISSAIDTTGANLIVVQFSIYGSDPGAGAFTDAKSNSWTLLTAYDVGVNHSAIYYAYAPTVGSGETFTTTPGAYCGFSVAAFSGSAASPLDQHTGGGNTGSTSLATGSITPGQANELVVAGIGSQGSTFSINSSYTIADSVNGSGSNQGTGIAYLLQGAAAPTNPTWSWTGAADASASIVSFK